VHIVWYVLTHFWLHHDTLFTKFGDFSVWVHWNKVHFSWLPGVQHWHGWQALWAWVNVHG
jgi:hypothetical protein